MPRLQKTLGGVIDQVFVVNIVEGMGGEQLCPTKRYKWKLSF